MQNIDSLANELFLNISYKDIYASKSLCLQFERDPTTEFICRTLVDHVVGNYPVAFLLENEKINSLKEELFKLIIDSKIIS